MAKNKTSQQDCGSASTAKGERVGSKSKRRHAPVVLELTLRPGVLSWLRLQACHLNNELGTRAITPAHIAHQIIRTAQEQAHATSIKRRQLIALIERDSANELRTMKPAHEAITAPQDGSESTESKSPQR